MFTLKIYQAKKKKNLKDFKNKLKSYLKNLEPLLVVTLKYQKTKIQNHLVLSVLITTF